MILPINSCDSSFATDIQRMTGGRGVGCVLNSLADELLRVSWNCIATVGTLVEIGMRDITDNIRLNMRPFGKSTTFASFDMPTLIDGDPAALARPSTMSSSSCTRVFSMCITP